MTDEDIQHCIQEILNAHIDDNTGELTEQDRNAIVDAVIDRLRAALAELSNQPAVSDAGEGIQ
jgi:hypothetical protein